MNKSSLTTQSESERRWGIIGCGDVTEIKSGPAFNKVANSHLVAVMRRDAVKAKDYAQRHGVPKWYNDAQQLINDPDVNAIYIATPPFYHEEYALKAFEAGKPVYLEKPMSINAASAKRIATAAEKSGVKLSIAHYRRQQPLFLKVKSLLNENAIGAVRLVNMQLFDSFVSNLVPKLQENWRLQPEISGGGLFYDLAPHLLDLMLYFFGIPKQLTGLSLNNAKYYDADDITCGNILFNNNIVFNGSWCFTAPPNARQDQCEIIGEKGTMRFKIFEHRQLFLTLNGKEEIISFDPIPHVQQPMIEKVVCYFSGNGPNPCSGQEGTIVMEMMDGILNKK